MTMPTTLGTYLNGLAVAAYGATPPDQNTIDLLQAAANILCLVPPAYVATGSSASSILAFYTPAPNSAASGGSPNELLTFDTIAAVVKATGIAPKSLGA